MIRRQQTIGTIKSVLTNLGAHNEMSIAGALKKNGLSRFPGTRILITPAKDIDNSYLTGLDENANYIRKMSAANAKIEKGVVKAYLEKAQQFYPNLDLGPRSEYWGKCIQKWGDENFAPVTFMKEGDNNFDLDNPTEFMQFCYLRVHPLIASSLKGYKASRSRKELFYVSDDNIEVKETYQTIQAITKATAKLGSLDFATMKKVAGQLGFSYNEHSKEESIFTMIYEFIKEAENDTSKIVNITKFNEFVSMDTRILDSLDTVNEAIKNGVIRKGKGGIIYRGNNRLADSIEEYEAKMVTKEAKEDLLDLQKEIKLKQSISS